MHKPVLAMGVDGWWPDEGDALNLPSRLVRNRFYWDAYQKDRPMSGCSRCIATARRNAAVCGRPVVRRCELGLGDPEESHSDRRELGSPDSILGTDIGGSLPTTELTGELYVRWFQFASFTTSFRSHGRTWKCACRGVGTPAKPDPSNAQLPIDPKELHNAQVEPICRKYLELHYRLMPYLYSACASATQTGIPVIRSLWLHYPRIPRQWRAATSTVGPNLLVAPVVEKGATSRKVYLPKGAWHDFWTGERLEGGREITRPVDWRPRSVRARRGIIRWAAKAVHRGGGRWPTEVRVYPGANGSFLLYEDDGRTFDFRKGEWMGIDLAWNDQRRTLSARLARGSKLLGQRELEVTLGSTSKRVVFEGRAIEVRSEE